MRQMTEHTLEIIKGLLPTSMYCLDFQASFDSTEAGLITRGYIPAGRCVSLNSSGNFKLGVDDQDMGLFLLNNSDDPDVKNDGGTLASQSGAWSPAMRSKLQAFVATGSFELATTEFQTSLTYNPNDKLTAPKGTGTASQLDGTAGILTNSSVKAYSHNVVGIVSRGRNSSSAKNAHGQPELYFWPIYLPKITGITEPTWS